MKHLFSGRTARLAARSVRVASLLVLTGLLSACQGEPVATAAVPEDASGGEAAAVFSVQLKPLRDGGDDVVAIQVQSTLDAGEAAAPLVLKLPLQYPGVPEVAANLQALAFQDADGALPMRVEDEPPHPGGFPAMRRWHPERAPVYPLTVSYVAPVQPESEVRGPPFGIRPSGGGVSGSGASFLMVPESVETAILQVQWDLSDLAEGSLAASTLGDGDFTVDGRAPEDLVHSWYMAGPAGRYPDNGDDHGLSGMWLGNYPWDPALQVKQIAKAYTYLGDFFGYLQPVPRYRLFMRMLETPPYGGATALQNSFMTSRGPANPGEGAPEGLGAAFHEMIHMWVGGLESELTENAWFAEGFTTHYTRLLAFRSGLSDLDRYVEDINRSYARYATHPAATWTPEQIVEVGFADNDVRSIPYARGAFYAADLDSRIRAQSGNARNFDVFLRELFEAREAGTFSTRDDWKQALERELGAEAVAEFERMIERGELVEPAPDAFGPCVERVEDTLEGADGRSVPGYRWVQVAGVSVDACRAW